MPTLTENNPQIYRVLEMVQAQLNEAVRSGSPGRIKYEDLNFSGNRLHDWNWPAIAYKEPLGKIGTP